MATRSEEPGNPGQREDIGFFQIVILILSVIALGALIADTAFQLPAEYSRVLQKIDTIICIVFLFDFCIRFARARSKREFMKWGWIDLISSIPNPAAFPYLSHLRWGRLVRLFRIIRLVRALRAVHKVSHVLLKDKFETGVASVVLTSILLVIFSSLGILICEQPDSQANIKSADDAVWWSVTTLTTVGYGDKYPVTAEGRLLAMVVMVSGMGLFGGLSGLAASFFIGNREKTIVAEESKILKRLEQLEAKIDRLGKN